MDRKKVKRLEVEDKRAEKGIGIEVLLILQLFFYLTTTFLLP